MTKIERFSLIAMPVLATAVLLASCSGKDNDVPESTPAKTASTAIAATAPPPAAMSPVPYVPEPVAGVITTCNIETFDKVPFQSAPAEAALSTTHSINGWIAAPQFTAPSFWLRLDDKHQEHYFQVRLIPSIKRPDVVAAASNLPMPGNSGFMLELPANAVPAGQYHLYLAVRADGKFTICDDGRQVDFK